MSWCKVVIRRRAGRPYDTVSRRKPWIVTVHRTEQSTYHRFVTWLDAVDFVRRKMREETPSEAPSS